MLGQELIPNLQDKRKISLDQIEKKYVCFERMRYHTAFCGYNIGEIPLARCLGADLDSQRKATNIIALIGRDVLSNCVFIYNGKAGVYTLAY